MSQDGISWSFHAVSHPYSSGSMPTVVTTRMLYTVSTDAPDANDKVKIKAGKSLNGSSWNFNDFLVDSNTSLGFKGVFMISFYFTVPTRECQQFVPLQSSSATIHKVIYGFPQKQ